MMAPKFGHVFLPAAVGRTIGLEHEANKYLDVYPLLRVHHGVVAHFQAPEDLHVLDVQAGKMLKGLHDGGLWGRRGRLIAFGYV